MKSKLKLILVDRGLKQNWLAEMIGISTKQMNMIVNNQAVPTLDVAFRIAEKLGLKVDEIWERE